jgi:phosphohistidine phosphatase
VKFLTLIRHAKSSWKNPQLTDFERPLNKRGENDAPRMAERFRACEPSPDLLVSSPAARALETARVFARELGHPLSRLALREDVYDAGVSDLLRVVQSFDDRLDHVAVCGHNPALTELCRLLTAAPIDNIPTCGIAQIRLRVESWTETSPGCGTLAHFDYPKKHRKGD